MIAKGMGQALVLWQVYFCETITNAWLYFSVPGTIEYLITNTTTYIQPAAISLQQIFQLYISITVKKLP